MSTQFTSCRVYRTSDRSKIISTLEKNPLSISVCDPILIGSRAARRYLPDFRGIPEAENTDWDLIISSEALLKWLNTENKNISTINMIVPLSNDDEEQLDLYLYCTLDNGSKYDFSVPRSSTSYTAYILNNYESWGPPYVAWHAASVKLLLILKKYMLYYSYQWEKTAKDYRELLAIRAPWAAPLTAYDLKLRDLFIRYNEKIHGKRPSDSDEFTIYPVHPNAITWKKFRQSEEVDSTTKRTGLIINRNEFFRYENDKQLSLIYQVAMSLSDCNDILIGLEHICTQGPLWLTDFVIKNWIDIFQEKFKYTIQSLPPPIQIEIENHRLFPDIPDLATKRILYFLTDTADFCSMQLVCKQWYAILRDKIFWRDLYTSRYGALSDQVTPIYSWKVLYLMRMEGKYAFDNGKLNQLIDATKELRQYTANDVWKLWEDFTHQDQSITPVLLSRINYILSNSFYYELEKTSEEYIVRLIIIGLEDAFSQSKMHLKLLVREYGHSFYSEHMELTIHCESSTHEQRSLDFFGLDLFRLHSQRHGYEPIGRTYLGHDASSISDQYPSGLLICLFIMMVHPDHRAHFIKYLRDLAHTVGY